MFLLDFTSCNFILQVTLCSFVIYYYKQLLIFVRGRYKIVSERRAVNAAELTDDQPTDVQSLASYLCVYDVEKFSDDADLTLSSVSVTYVSNNKD